jgi:hypothetical protein
LAYFQRKGKAQRTKITSLPWITNHLALPGGLGDEFDQLLPHFLRFTLGAAGLGFAMLPDAHDAVELFSTFIAEIHVGGHGFLLG